MTSEGTSEAVHQKRANDWAGALHQDHHQTVPTSVLFQLGAILNADDMECMDYTSTGLGDGTVSGIVAAVGKGVMVVATFQGASISGGMLGTVDVAVRPLTKLRQIRLLPAQNQDAQIIHRGLLPQLELTFEDSSTFAFPLSTEGGRIDVPRWSRAILAAADWQRFG